MSKSWNTLVPKPRKNRFRWLIYVALAAVYIWAFRECRLMDLKKLPGSLLRPSLPGYSLLTGPSFIYQMGRICFEDYLRR